LTGFAIAGMTVSIYSPDVIIFSADDNGNHK
jgi:hypothetical protein